MSIVFRDVSHLKAWCSGNSQHVAKIVDKITPGWSFHMSFLTEVKIAMVLTAVASAYYLGKEGLPDTWQGIKNIYSWIRNLFGGKTQTSVPAPTPTPTQPISTPVA